MKFKFLINGFFPLHNDNSIHVHLGPRTHQTSKARKKLNLIRFYAFYIPCDPRAQQTENIKGKILIYFRKKIYSRYHQQKAKRRSEMQLIRRRKERKIVLLRF